MLLCCCWSPRSQRPLNSEKRQRDAAKLAAPSPRGPVAAGEAAAAAAGERRSKPAARSDVGAGAPDALDAADHVRHRPGCQSAPLSDTASPHPWRAVQEARRMTAALDRPFGSFDRRPGTRVPSSRQSQKREPIVSRHPPSSSPKREEDTRAASNYRTPPGAEELAGCFCCSASLRSPTWTAASLLLLLYVVFCPAGNQRSSNLPTH
uniref:Uncharacterized protein n=1 Tax=Plectus sambesii TaxID=2011161 RepID=A0A914ULN2_9BILA